MKKAFISREDLLAIDFKGSIGTIYNMSPELLWLLKEKGAPIKGTIELVPDFENYNWNHYEAIDGGHYVQWNEKLIKQQG